MLNQLKDEKKTGKVNKNEIVLAWIVIIIWGLICMILIIYPIYLLGIFILEILKFYKI